MSEEKTEIKGENEAGTSPGRLVTEGKNEVAIPEAKIEKRGGGEVGAGQEKAEIKGEEDAGISIEKPVIKGAKEVGISEENDAAISPEEPTKKSGNADAVILFRVRKNLKQNLKDEAKSRGITLTELILSRVKGSKVRDRKNEEKIISVIEDFTREFNQIGNNINQIAVAIHQIKNEHRIESGQFAEIANALEVYNERIETLRSSIHKIESDDI